MKQNGYGHNPSSSIQTIDSLISFLKISDITDNSILTYFSNFTTRGL